MFLTFVEVINNNLVDLSLTVQKKKKKPKTCHEITRIR